jgi:CMP-N-acetylneuraminic acid synthetase
MPTPVSIIITARNYAKYLPRAIESALGQSHPNVEVVVVDDGSTDHTAQVLQKFQQVPNLKVVTTTGIGLAAAANQGVAASTGEYIVRLDADDWFEENLALVEATFLDRNPNVGMVYCDYHTVDVHGDIIDHVRRAKVNEEVELLDRPALAAGAMYRRRCFDVLGGYDASLRYQEDYDFWIRFIEKFEVRNISLPLMYYRQHGRSMSRNFDARMQSRRAVKKRFVQRHRKPLPGPIYAIVPARSDLLGPTKVPLLKLERKTLLRRAIEKLKAVKEIDRIIVSTDDAKIAAEATAHGGEVPFLRPQALLRPGVPFEDVIAHLLKKTSANGNAAEIVVIFNPTSPFISQDHIAEALDTMRLYETDSVIATVVDLTYHWRPGRTGLMPVGYTNRVVKEEKELIYKEAGGLYVTRSRFLLNSDQLLGQKIGHIELAPHEAVRIASFYDWWVAQRMTAAGSAWEQERKVS